MKKKTNSTCFAVPLQGKSKIHQAAKMIYFRKQNIFNLDLMK
jgi:hypothetical protein